MNATPLLKGRTASVFLDCEFTELEKPLLLSLALVLDTGKCFYGELAGPPPKNNNQDFLDEHVLSQFGNAPFSFVNAAGMARAVSEWLTALDVDRIEVHYDYHADMDLFEALLKKEGLWQSWQHFLVPNHVAYIYSDARVEEFMEKAWLQEELNTGLKKHHALADARVLCQAFDLVHN